MKLKSIAKYFNTDTIFISSEDSLSYNEYEGVNAIHDAIDRYGECSVKYITPGDNNLDITISNYPQ